LNPFIQDDYYYNGKLLYCLHDSVSARTNFSQQKLLINDPIYIVIDEDESENNLHDCQENGEDHDVPHNGHGI